MGSYGPMDAVGPYGPMGACELGLQGSWAHGGLGPPVAIMPL